MRRATPLALALAPLLAGPAGAVDADVVMTTGVKGGSYYSIGGRLKTELLLTHDKHVDVVQSAGSLENLSLLDDPQSRVGLGLTQSDALKRYLDEHPDFADEFIVLGDVGKECVLMVSKKGGAVSSVGDLKGEPGYEISVVAPDSGAAVTWEMLSGLDPALAHTSPVHVDAMEAMLQVREDSDFSKLKVLMLVQRPLQRSPVLQLLLDNPDDWALVPIVEGDVGNTTLPNGSPVYSFEEVSVGGKQRSRPIRIQTVCTRGLLLGVRAKLGDEMRGLLSRTMLDQGKRIVGADE